jgi:predicted membrane-bound dolichyl-phosphate-mannose-protein mannosyltransferase
LKVTIPRGRSAPTVEWFFGSAFALVAVVCVLVAAYYFSMTLCPPVSVTTGLTCVLRAAAVAPKGEMWLLAAGIMAFIAAVSYPMARFGGASFVRGRLFRPGSLEGDITGWEAKLFVPLLLLAYAALQLAEILLVPGGNQPYSDPQAFYIPAALDILNGTRCPNSPYSSTCNYEHPPLDKLFLALSIKTFGKNAVGYSIFPLLFGAGTLLLTYGIAMEVSGHRVARYAAFFLLIDGTFLGLYQQAWTDVPMVFFGLFAFYVYVAKLKNRPALRMVVAGSLMGLSILSKETGVLFLVAIALYSLLVSRDTSLSRLVLLLGTTALVSAAGLQLYDTLFTPFPTFIAHIQYILHYNSLIGVPGWPQESWLPFLGKSVVPIAWLFFYPPFGFISTMPEEWLLLASLPVIVYFLGWKMGSLGELERRIVSFVPVWLGSTFAFYFFAQLFRSTYPFYMIQMLPAVVIADGWMMTKFTRPIKVVFVIGCLAWLYVFFPLTPTAEPVLAYVSKWITCVASACPGGI